MNKWLKNFAVAAATTGAVALSAVSASAVSFTVVIDKIELMQNGNSGSRIPVYQPAAGVGESTTRTVDLFDATAKAGTGFTIGEPPTGTYETMLVTFDAVDIKQDTGAVSATASLAANLQSSGVVASELGKFVMILGDAGTGAGSIGTALGGLAAAAPLQPIVFSGGALTLPSLNFFLPASSVSVDTAGNASGTIIVKQLPAPIPAADPNADNAAVPNFTFAVKHNAFRGTGEIADTATSFVAKLGLFGSADDAKPVMVKSFTFTSSTALTDNSITEVVLNDVPFGTWLPLVWIDADSDGLLDVGEPVIMNDLSDQGVDSTAATGGGADHEHFIDVRKADLVTSSVAADVSAVSAAYEASRAGGALGAGAGNALTGAIGQSGNFYLMPNRAISLSVNIAPEASATTTDNVADVAANSAFSVSAVSAISDAADGTLTFVVYSGSVSTTSIPLSLDWDRAGTGALLAVGFPVFKSTVSAGLTADGNAGTVIVKDVPLTLTSLANTATLGGTFQVDLRTALGNAGAAVGSTDIYAPVNQSSTQTSYASATSVVSVSPTTGAVSLTLSLGN